VCIAAIEVKGYPLRNLRHGAPPLRAARETSVDNGIPRALSLTNAVAIRTCGF
jgi:hypothetical protein